MKKSSMRQPSNNEKIHSESGTQSRFDALLTAISSLFINLSVDRINAEIENTQQLICEAFDLDRSTLFQIADDESEILLLTHIHQPPESRRPPERMALNDFWPWSIKKILAGESLIISKMSDLPAEAGRDREAFDRYGAKSLVAVPLLAGNGSVFGLLTFSAMRQEKTWAKHHLQQFELVAQVFANALLRRQKELALIENQKILLLTTEASGAGLWQMDIKTGHVRVTPKTREIFHFRPDEILDMGSFFQKIHPDDHDQVKQAVQQTIQTGKHLQSEYRIVLPDGSLRWIMACGKPHGASAENAGHLLGLSLDITEQKQLQEKLKRQLHEITALKKQLEQDNLCLKQEVALLMGDSEILGQSPAMEKILALAEQVAPTDSTIILLGETGTGKSLLAKAIHNISARKNRPMVTINCAAIPAALIESELFGRERGAYTGALTQMAGRFELADKSTLFLDEIGELPLDVQSKLLRVLEQGRFERLGSTAPKRVNVRIIAATNRDLPREVNDGRFRQDLYYRLNVFPILIPPLRERREDIPLMVWTFVREFQKKMGKQIESISKKSMELLQSYSWPGNVRELRNIIEHAMILTRSTRLVFDIPLHANPDALPISRLDDMERSHILRALERSGGRVAGKNGAAQALGLKRTTLYSKMRKLGIDRPISK